MIRAHIAIKRHTMDKSTMPTHSADTVRFCCLIFFSFKAHIRAFYHAKDERSQYAAASMNLL